VWLERCRHVGHDHSLGLNRLPDNPADCCGIRLPATRAGFCLDRGWRYGAHLHEAARHIVIEAGLQATLERQIGKVQVTIEELQKLAAAMAKANLTQLAMSGQIMHGLNTEVKFGIRGEIIASLKEIGVSDADAHDVQEIWISVYCDMLVSDIAGEAEKLLPRPPRK
jgi:hypothetical protein